MNPYQLESDIMKQIKVLAAARGISMRAAFKEAAEKWIAENRDAVMVSLASSQTTNNVVPITPTRSRMQQEQVEKQMIEAALRLHQGNVSAVKRELGTSSSNLYCKFARYGIDYRSYRPRGYPDGGFPYPRDIAHSEAGSGTTK